MPDITIPNLPADLPEDWTNEQIVSAGGTEAGLTPQHGYNYLMKQVNDAQAAIILLAQQTQAAIENGTFNAMATRTGTTVAITGPEEAFIATFTAPADWVAGDTYTYNGSELILTNLNNEEVSNGWKQGAPLVFYLLGSRAYFVTGGGGGFIEMSESIPTANRYKSVLYGLILADFDSEEANG